MTLPISEDNKEKYMNKPQTGFWMDTERTFKEVINSFADIDIKSRIAVL